MLDLGGEHVDCPVSLVDPGEHRGAHEGVMIVEPACERVFEPIDLGTHPATGHVGKDLRVTLPGNQRVDHLPTGLREHRRRDR